MHSFFNIQTHGYIRIACATPLVHLSNPKSNLIEHINLIHEAITKGAQFILFPELSLTGYSNDDLFSQKSLLDQAQKALCEAIILSRSLPITMIIGVPLRIGGALYNGAAIITQGRTHFVPKIHLPNYREFYDKRYFASGHGLDTEITFNHNQEDLVITIAPKMVFSTETFGFGVEICEDIWVAHTPSTNMALNGAHLIFNLSASPVTIGKNRARKRLCASGSERLICAYAYSAAGRGESTTDLAWDGQSLIYELGDLIAEGERFQHNHLTFADIDMDRIQAERLKNTSFEDARRHLGAPACKRQWPLPKPIAQTDLIRPLNQTPYVSMDESILDADAFEAIHIQTEGLIGRLRSTKVKNVVIGISGGLDSTLALLITTKAFDKLGISRQQIHGYTMPGFGTSVASKNDALKLMKAMKISGHSLDIRPTAKRMLMDIDHPTSHGQDLYDLTFENVQAGLRTDYLFRLAGSKNGFVVGTGDLSELALGWCTYGVGDHMSHYNVNAGAPKTLIRHLIEWVARHEKSPLTAKILKSIANRTISPELIPPGRDGQIQTTEATTGPYELVDYFLYHVTRTGTPPSKIAFMAIHSFKDVYDSKTIVHWLKVFLKRFFHTSQYKRSAQPNGPKLVSSGSLSPRGDWRAPSDSTAETWLDELKSSLPDDL